MELWLISATQRLEKDIIGSAVSSTHIAYINVVMRGVSHGNS